MEAQAVLPALEWNDCLALAAQDHCDDIGPKGSNSHTGSDGSSPWDRMSRYGRWSGSVGENLDFSPTTGDEMMDLLYVDDGVSSRGHRTNMINPAFKQVGMSYCPHARYGDMIVVDFATVLTPNQACKDALKTRKPKY